MLPLSPASRRVFAIDVGSHRVVCGRFSSRRGGRLCLEDLVVERAGSVTRVEDGWEKHLAECFDAVGRRAGFNGAAALGVPGPLALTKFVKTPAIAASKRAKVVQFEAVHSIPYALDEVVWDHAVVGDDGVDLELMLVAAKVQAVETICAAAEDARWAPHRVLPPCIALAECCRLNYPEPGGALLVDVGARSTQLVFVEPSRIFVRTLNFGGEVVTRRVAEELSIGIDDAESLKVLAAAGENPLADNSPECATTVRACREFNERLGLEISRSLLAARRHCAAINPARLLLTGGGSMGAGLPSSLVEKLQLPVERFEPLRRVGVTRTAEAAGARSLEPFLAVTVGLAAGAIRAQALTINLLPRARRDEIRSRRRMSWALTSVALLAAALLAPIRHFQVVEERTRVTLAALETQALPLRALARQNAERLAQLEAVKKQVEALDQLARARTAWLGFLGDLQERLAQIEDVWLDRLAIGETRAGGEDEAAESPPLRLELGGRLLDRSHPLSRVSAESYARVKQLLASIAESEFVATIENPRFDNSQPGVLRFEFTLVAREHRGL